MKYQQPRVRDLKQGGYSDGYVGQVKVLRDYFSAQISQPDIPCVELTDAEYEAGTDSLKEPFRGIVATAIAEWKARNYELSYNQLCCGFFLAALECGKLRVGGAK